MKFYFGGSSSGIQHYKDQYLLICEFIKKRGHKIIHDWVEEVINLEKGGMYKNTAAAIKAADGVILEGTVSSVGVGQQLTLALESNKPTLILIQAGTKGKSTTNGSFIDPSKKYLLYVEKYTLKNLEKILDKFFRNLLQKHGLTRINLVLNRSLDSYLEWSSFETKRSKSQIIRESLRKEMEQDLNWKKSQDD